MIRPGEGNSREPVTSSFGLWIPDLGRPTITPGGTRTLDARGTRILEKLANSGEIEMRSLGEERDRR